MTITIGTLEFELSKLSLAPDDIVLFTCPAALTQGQIAEILVRIKSQLGRPNLAIVLTGGAELSSLTRADIEAMAARQIVDRA